MEEHRPKKLLDQVRDAIRLKHYSIHFHNDPGTVTSPFVPVSEQSRNDP